MEELRKYRLGTMEWDALIAFQKILAVSFVVSFSFTASYLPQVPHAFQQRLSSEKTPTLCEALPSFEAMKNVWTQQKTTNPEMASIINAGLDKLEDYRDRAELVPAYVLAMGK